MASSMIKISGELFVPHLGTTPFQLPFGITIELTMAGAENAGGWIGSASIGTDNHKFDLLTAHTIKTGDTVNYTIYRNEQLIQEGQSLINNFQTDIQLSEASYDRLQISGNEGFITIKGKVTLGDERNPAIPLDTDAVTIFVNKLRFREKALLGTSKIDTYGNYEVKIPVFNLLDPNAETTCSPESLINIVVSLYSGDSQDSIENLIVKSEPLSPADCCTQIDLHISTSQYLNLFATELDGLVRIVFEATQIPREQLYTIIIDESNSELPALSVATRLPEQKLRTLIEAARFSNYLNIVLEHSYALNKAKGNDYATWVILDMQDLQLIITRAITNKLISTNGDVNDTYAKLNKLRAGIVSADPTVGGDSLQQALYAILPSYENVEIFVGLAVDNPELDAKAFWNLVGTRLPDEKASLQKGMQVLAITGMQIETTKELISSLAQDDQGRPIETPLPVSSTALWNDEKWHQFVLKTSAQNGGRLCIPPVFLEQSQAAGRDPQVDYATKLETITKDTFATVVLTDKISKDPEYAESFNGYATDIKKYFEAKKDIDLRFQNIWDIYKDAEEYLSPGNTAEALKDALMPMQNVIRLTGGKPEAVAAILKSGIKSSSDIAAMPMESFVSTFETSFGSTHIAEQVYSKSVQTAAVVGQIQVQYNPSQVITNTQALQTISPVLWETFIVNPGTSQSPDLQTLFGSMDLCSCSECMSMYSPAAYYTDILNFMKTKLIIGSGNPPIVYDEVLRRRPDLLHIDLSCKNANTALPYIDLVNEQLELMILRKEYPSPLPPASYQTSGTAKELEAYPEHTVKLADYTYNKNESFKNVYNLSLKNAIYPNTLPLDLPLEESRVYLTHLGHNRADMLNRLKPFDYKNIAENNAAISEYNILNESLGISKQEADIISGINVMPGTTPPTPPPTNQYYGSFPASPVLWYNQLFNAWGATPAPAQSPGLGLLLERTRISYAELLQLLNTNFLNPITTAPQRRFEIESFSADGEPNNQDTCDLKKLRIICNGPAPDTLKQEFFKQLHRYLRLCRATNWSTYQLDMVLSSLEAQTIDTTIYKQVARIHALSIQLHTTPEKLCGFWNKLSTYSYTNYSGDSQNEMPSVYDSLFRNKSVFNPPSPLFDNPLLWPPALTYTEEHKGTIMAACNIKEEEMVSLFRYVNGSANPNALSLGILSHIYGLSLLARGLGKTIKDLLRVCALFEIPGAIPATPADRLTRLFAIKDAIEALDSQAFDLDEMDYLIAHKDEQAAFTPLNDDIALFYGNLRTALQKLVAENPDITVNEKLIGNMILRQFSTGFNLDTSLASYLLQDVLSITGTLIPTLFLYDALSNERFINSQLPLIPTNFIADYVFEELYIAYRKISKIAMIVNKVRISADEFKAIQLPLNPASGTVPTVPGIEAFGFIHFDQLSTVLTADTADNLNALLKLLHWIDVRNLLNLNKEELIQLFKDTLLVNGSASGWITAISDLTAWSPADLEFLLGDTSNILHADNSANGDFLDGRLLKQLISIIDASGRIGLAPDLVYKVLKSDLQLDASQRIRQAAKAKHTDDEWLKIARPLQNALREKQRKALVDYIVVRPNMADGINPPSYTDINGTKWKNENELYAYLLIDVEMQPCMKTSRLKQGISSLQLFMDRVILNLENKNGDTSNHIYITTEQREQWKTWRKWYRVWEANRKIFLYPENWIEPELRDDKTPFFKELETQILQDEITQNTAEEAFRLYLEKIDEVSRLEPMSAYHQVEAATATQSALDIMHVISRTAAQPHRYFYRRLEDNEWSPWEKVNAGIKGDHIVPVVWNRRLYLFWLEFTQKTTKRWYNESNALLWVNKIQNKNGASGSVMTIVDDANESDKKITWDVRLNWSQYKDGKWLADEVCDDVMNINPARFKLTSTEAASYDAVTGDPLKFGFFSHLTDNGQKKLAELFKERIFMTGHFDGNAEDPALILSLDFFSRADEAGAITLMSFKFPDPVSRPFAERAWEREYLILAPLGTRAKSMKFREMLPGYGGNADIVSGLGKLRIERVMPYTDYHFSYFYDEYKGSPSGFIPTKRWKYGSNPDILLNETPSDYGNFALTKVANETGSDSTSCIRNYFFFEDEKNTFFVRRIEDTPAVFQYVNTNFVTVQAATTLSITAYTPDISAGITAHVPAPAAGPTVQQVQSYSYYFQTFYHAQIHKFMKALNKDGVPGLLQIINQKQSDSMNFGIPGLNNGKYKPTNLVHTNYPKNNVQFKTGDPYSIYNWEIFFHAPMLIAQRLSENQRFEEAQQWYHYIFNPTSSTDINNAPIADKKRFWKFFPFYEQASSDPQTLQELMADIADNVNSATKQVSKWEKNPFQPHVIARLRVLAYMKNVVMKYIDNLIAWGDQLFRRDTIESINEGTQLYILAANILGKRPENIPPRVKRKDHTFLQLLTANPGTGLDSFSNGMVNIEAFFSPNTGTPTGSTSTGNPTYGRMSYFCLPKNDKLMSYWDTVADRLYKIRNCMNIDGVVRQLPLYEPPIDPALLVKATAMGIDINSLLDTVSGQGDLSHYRFNYTLQKANEFCNDVQGLGSSLLSALEKKDGEELALLRSGQEMQLLEKIRFIKEAQVQEAEANLEAMKLGKENTQIRLDYYSSRPFTNASEQKHLESIQTGLVLQAVQAGLEGTVGTLSLMPVVHIQGLATGTSFGGANFANAIKAVSTAVGIAASINNAKGSMALTLGGYERRRDDWNFQVQTAQKELAQMDQQILASEIRLDIATKELTNHELQMENTAETDRYMRSKFTNKELYSWMSGQIAATYFQSYQLAYDMAKKADASYQYELPLAQRPVGGFISFGYWDSLRKGLMSGEKLQFDLRKMEATYMEGNKREFELTKNISLAMNSPQSLLQLRENGSCEFILPEELFDLDYPGHYLRRIKSVSISLPCVAGPYTTIAATLKLGNSMLRKTDNPNEVLAPELAGFNSAIATSGGQNDSGVFELNFRDERYLPFEGRGVVDSSWTLHLADSNQVRLFDFSTLTDVIVHIRYTAQEGSSNFTPSLKTKRIENINTILAGPGLMPRYFNIKHEFNNEWYEGFNHLVNIEDGAGSTIGRELDLKIQRAQFPEYTAGKTITVDKAYLYFKNTPDIAGIKVEYNGTLVTPTVENGYLKASINAPGITLSATENNIASFRIVLYNGTVALDESDLDDVFLLMNYSL